MLCTLVNKKPHDNYHVILHELVDPNIKGSRVHLSSSQAKIFHGYFQISPLVITQMSMPMNTHELGMNSVHEMTVIVGMKRMIYELKFINFMRVAWEYLLFFVH